MYDNIVKILTILVIVIMICILTSYFNLMLKLMMLFLFTLLQERGLRRQCKVYWTPILTIINVILMFVSLLSWFTLTETFIFIIYSGIFTFAILSKWRY